MDYNDLRAAVSRGFSVENLHHVTRIGYDLLGADVPLKHPSAAYAVATTAEKIVWHCEGQAVPEETAAAIEAHIRPKMEAVIDAAEGDAGALMTAIDDLARAYIDTLPFLKSIGS